MGHAISKIIEGNWDEIQGKVQQEWGKLTENDLKTVEGSYTRLVGKLKKAYGFSEAELEDKIYNFLKEEGLVNFKQKAEDLWENAVEVKDNVKHTIQKTAKQVKNTSADLQEDVIEYVKANPVKSVGFAMVIGMILSKIIKK